MTGLVEPPADWGPFGVECNRARRGHRFFPLVAPPGLGDTDHLPDSHRLVVEHYFVGASHWWLIEADPATMEGFFAQRLNGRRTVEFGFVSLSELERLLLGDDHMPILRDSGWVAQPVEAVLALPPAPTLSFNTRPYSANWITLADPHARQRLLKARGDDAIPTDPLVQLLVEAEADFREVAGRSLDLERLPRERHALAYPPTDWELWSAATLEHALQARGSVFAPEGETMHRDECHALVVTLDWTLPEEYAPDVRAWIAGVTADNGHFEPLPLMPKSQGYKSTLFWIARELSEFQLDFARCGCWRGEELSGAGGRRHEAYGDPNTLLILAIVLRLIVDRAARTGVELPVACAVEGTVAVLPDVDEPTEELLRLEEELADWLTGQGVPIESVRCRGVLRSRVSASHMADRDWGKDVTETAIRAALLVYG